MKFFPVTGPRHAYHYTGSNPKFNEISHDPKKSVLFSIVMPVYKGKIKWLIKAINSYDTNGITIGSWSLSTTAHPMKNFVPSYQR